MKSMSVYSMCVCKVHAYAYITQFVSIDCSQSHSDQVNGRWEIREDEDEVVRCGLVVLATRHVRFTKYIQTLQVSQVFSG